ncbi:MAG: D-alanine--D-alanine ligase [Candidatus Omnitrophota bacterium]
MTQKRIGVLMGGPSCEREISIRSGKAVCGALKNRNLKALPIELMPSFGSDNYADKVRMAILSADINAAFIALHGEFGEDGKIQGILEDLKIPYTGSGVAASRAGMDKIRTKSIFRSGSIPVPEDRILERQAFDNGFDASVYFRELGGKVVVKPYDGGSSIGLDIVSGAEGLRAAAMNAFRYSDKVMIEEYVPGREITVGIVEDRALPIVEIVPKREFFDFTAKYEKGLTEYIVPAKIDGDARALCQDVALAAHKALGARSFSRVDIILNDSKGPVVLEVNTIPGLTETSLLPKAALAAGIDFEGLCLKILDSASW